MSATFLMPLVLFTALRQCLYSMIYLKHIALPSETICLNYQHLNALTVQQASQKDKCQQGTAKMQLFFPPELSPTRKVRTSQAPSLDVSQCHLVSLARTGNKNSAGFLPLLLNPFTVPLFTVPPSGNFTTVCFLYSPGTVFLINTCT